jgi:hypothetical protein
MTERRDSDVTSLAPSFATADIPLGIPDNVVSPLPPVSRAPRELENAPLTAEGNLGIELGLRVRRTRDMSNVSLPPPYELVPGTARTQQTPGTSNVPPPKDKTKRCCFGLLPACPPISSQASDALIILSQFVLILVSSAIVVLMAIGTPTTPSVNSEASASLLSFNISGLPSRELSEIPSEDTLRQAFGDSYDLFRPWYDRVGQARTNVDLSLRLNLTMRSVSSLSWDVEWAKVTVLFPNNRTVAGVGVSPGFTLNGSSLNSVLLDFRVNRTLGRFDGIANDTVLNPLFASCGLLPTGRPQDPDVPRQVRSLLSIELSVFALRMWSWTGATQPSLVINKTVTWEADEAEWRAKATNLTARRS